jgi:hypothetical protein
MLNLYLIHILNTNLVIYIDDNPKRLSKLLNKNKKISDFLVKNLKSFEIEENEEGAVFIDENGCPILFFVNKINNETLVHEIIHLVDFLANYFKFENELEFKAYLGQSIYRDIIKLK